MSHRKRQTKPTVPTIEVEETKSGWEITNMVAQIFAVIFSAVWFYFGRSIEALIALIGSLAIVFTSRKFKKVKYRKTIDIIFAILLSGVAAISLVAVIMKQNTPTPKIYPTLNFAPIKKENGFTDGFTASFLETNTKMEIAAVYYPTFFDVSIFDEFIEQPDFKFYPYHLNMFLKGLYKNLPMHSDLVEMGQGGSFPIIISPNYTVNGKVESFFGLYMLDYAWSRSKDGTGVMFKSVRLIQVFDDPDAAQKALDDVAKIALQNIIDYELKGFESSVNVADGEIRIAGKGENISISIEDILKQK